MNKLHFREIDFFVYLPAWGYRGRSLDRLEVTFRDRLRGTTRPNPHINLGELLQMPEIRDHYPHSVGLYRKTTATGRWWRQVYSEVRVIRDEPELRAWIAELGH